MSAAADLLRRKADDYKALCEEYETRHAAKVPYKVIELVLREVAEALEAEDREREAA